MKLFALDKLKLRVRIMAITGCTLLGMVAISSIFVTQKAQIESLNVIERDAAKHLEILGDARAEVEGVLSAISALALVPSEENVANVDLALEEMVAHADLYTSEPAVRAGVLALPEHAHVVVEESKLLGLDENAGLKGALNGSVRDAEAALNAAAKAGVSMNTALVQMLILRRNEKDFMLGGDETYLGEFDANTKNFATALGRTRLSGANKNVLTGFMAAYQSDFHAFVAGAVDLAHTLELSNSEIHSTIDLIDDRRATYSEKQHVVQAQLESQWSSFSLILLGVILIVAIVVVGLSLIIGRSITKPAAILTATMERLADGDYDLEIDGQDGTSELGAMARAVEVFRKNGLLVREFEAKAQDQMRTAADHSSQIEAIGKAQAVIEFTTKGEIVQANDNFLNALGYQMSEIAGKHHAMFVEPEFAASAEYRTFWDNLANGEYQSAEYKRIGKGGREVWIQASYNPIFDPDGKVSKVVKYATDVTQRKLAVDMLGKSLKLLADGNLQARIETKLTGEFEEVRTALNETVDRLVEIVGRLRVTSSGVKSATGEILAGANDLSERTTKQAATIEETSAAMEQLATTVMENAEKADNASSQSRSVSKTAQEGGEIVSRANDAMERIRSSSEKISNIIGMIDDIAFQTNLLALNASVEAARAGEAGKGFAVVAIEVRRLAQSAAEASSEVKVLVEQSASEVGDGSKLVTEAAEKLTEMITTIQDNSSLIESIASDSRNQANSLEEVNTAVRQMDEMTQHNAALVEETNAAIEQTEAQANELDRIVDVFKLGNGGSASAGPKVQLAANGARELQQKVAASA